MNLWSHRFYLSCLFVLFTAGSAFAQFVDIGVSKSGPASAAAGTDVSYDVFVFNSGSDDAASVTLDDPIPAGMTFVSVIQNSGVPFSCSAPSAGATTGSVNCTAPLLMPGENADFTITLHIPPGATAGTTFLNVATVSTISGDGNSENDSSAAGTTVPSTAADVGVSKSGPSAAPPGANVTYTITVANGSPNDAQTVSLNDTLPGTMTFASLTQSGPLFTCTTPSAGAGGTITCSIATLISGTSTTFTLTGNIAGNTSAGTTFVNTANITSADDPNPENDSSSSTVTVSSVDLSATKNGPPTATGGQDVTYTIGIANAGPDTAFNATLTDPLPSGTTFVSLTQNTGPSGSCVTPFAGFTGTVQCSFATSMTSGTSATFTLVVHVGVGVANGSTLTNTATVSSDSFDSNPANDNASTSATVTALADIGVIKSGPGTVVAGSTASYTINVTNGGPSDATNAQLSDTLPASTTFVSLTQNTGQTAACTTPVVGSSGTVTCSWLPLASGASATFTLVVQTSPGTPAGPLANTATVSTTASDPNGANNSSTATATVSSVADLGVTKTGPATIVAGNNAAYTITVTNSGPSDAAAAQLTDVLPASTTFISLNQTSGPSASCTAPAVGGTGSVTCSWASLVNGSTAVFSLTVKTNPNTAPGPLTNTATVTTTSTDPNGANNSSSTTANVVLTDVGIAKSIPPGLYVAGQPITFTLDVTNNAAQPASGIVVTDSLPAGMTLVSTTPAGACSGTTTITCNAAALAPGQTTTFTITALLPATPGPLTNTASVSTATGDANPANDSSSVTFIVIAASAIPTISPLVMALIALAFTAIALRAGRA